MAEQNLTTTLIAAPAMSPADAAAHWYASYVRPTPTVDVAAILTATAAALTEQPARSLTTNRLLLTVLDAAGPTVSVTALRPVWEALPLDPDGSECREYAARLTTLAQQLER